MLVNRSPSTPTTSSYKTNVNRTKTKKWVEAKVQNYDGDDWGNEYDDYDDGSDQHDEPEPPHPSRLIGLRQPGQMGQQLPSSRTFSQPATSFSSAGDARMPGPSALRSPSGPPSLHVQTQQTLPSTNPSPYTTTSALPESHSTTPLQASMAPLSQNAGPGPTPSRFPPRKSSMGQQDRPDIGEKVAPKSDSRPGSSSSNRPWMDQRSASPNHMNAPAGKALPFVRPADIYKRMEEEKEKERMSMDSGRPSMDSLLGRNEGTSSPGQFRLSGEQRRRTSFESHDGSESTRGLKSTLAPVAERKSEYGMEGFFAKAQVEQPFASHEPLQPKLEQSLSQSEVNDEVKADLLKSRRFSTSPQLPSFSRVSGFGDDLFKGSGGYNHPTSLNPPTIPGKSQTQANEETDAVKEAAIKKGQQQSIVRPRLPGGWVSESTTAASEQPTPLERKEILDPTPLASVENVSVSPLTESDAGPSELNATPEAEKLQSSVDASESTPRFKVVGQLSGEQPDNANGKYDGIRPPGVVVTGSAHHPTPQSLPPLKTKSPLAEPSSRPISTTAPTVQPASPQTQASPATQPASAATRSEFSPTAPLNPNRVDADQPNIVLPSIYQRKSTVSTIETASPEKESDKLREEIIKSLSPAPGSPSASGLPTEDDTDTSPTPGDLTRESTYLAGVYDDYLSPAEEKSLQEVSQIAKKSAQTPQNHITEPNTGIIPELNEMPVSQPAPLSPVKSPMTTNNRSRRFSWEQGLEEVALGQVEAESAASVFPQRPQGHGQGGNNTGLDTKANAISPVSASLGTETGALGTISHQVSQVSSRAPEDASLAAIEPPSPISYMADKSPKPTTSDEPNNSYPSLADEKQKVLIDDTRSETSSTVEQHPALAKAPEQEHLASSLMGQAPDVSAQQLRLMPFREILNIGSPEQRIKKFDETRDQFYAMDSGLSDWLVYLQSQLEHANAVAPIRAQSPVSNTGSQPASVGTQGASQLPYYQQMINASRASVPASHARRTSVGNVQHLMAGQSSSFGGSGNQVGTKSKELLHAAGAFGNKGMKSGMKLFNKGKNKLRERTGGDKAFF
ncbi:hypothetical protein F5Y19DRAFT_401694 [Xylariaceae sp. FL1651]|nr:hypothetical protein F5Y19DRAFT_401694 [Xylariaceae sp. FL1651]